MPRKYLLSIDGGGLRGVIPACVLAELERQTGRLVRETFSFVAGTSTGAIIAAAVAAGIPAERIVHLYLSLARRVFDRRPWSPIQRFISGSMYSTEILNELIEQELGGSRDWVLNDAPIDLLITAKRVGDGMPWYFVKDKPTNSGATGRLRLADCVTASAAAPTYFSPWTIGGVGELVDGGVGVAGNPVYQACVEAFYYTGEYVPEETVVVSLGTGRYAGERRPSGGLGWVEWVIGELLRSPGEQQTDIVERHFAATPLYRVDQQLTEDFPLDDVRHLGHLRRIGERLAADVDWRAILSGGEARWKITPDRTLPMQYARPPAM